MKDPFSKILISYRFKELDATMHDVQPFKRDFDGKEELYAEVYNQGTWYYCWIVGKGIPNSGYPGGLNITEPGNLKSLLKSLPLTK